VDSSGRYLSKSESMTDQLCGKLPAVPVGNTYWGYTSVPIDGCNWWKDLPTHPSQQK
jgi:hypothetical protein